MKFKETRKEQLNSLESKIFEISRKLEDLIMQFNLYFSGEIRVPPELERESLASVIRALQNNSPRNASGSLRMQNLNARFSLYNNMWLKKMNDIEIGLPLYPAHKTPLHVPVTEELKPKPSAPVSPITLDLNAPDSFKDLYSQYLQLMTDNKQKIISDQALSSALATRMKEANVAKASVSISFENGKLKIRLKK